MRSPSAPLRRFAGFVHVADGELVDGAGNVLRLRGVGLGNWLLPEGYMWGFEPGGACSPRQIESLIADLVGGERAAEFWREFRDRFITEADIAKIAAEGLDHVRLAINSRVLLTEAGELIEDGFRLIDRLIGWCRAHEIWVVLDLHGAPGGQTGTNIDDSPRALPELFTDARYARQCVDLWRAIAIRYRDETVVAAYDLLNEPLPNEYQHLYAAELVALYKELTAAVRAVDPNHVLIYEGTHWSTNWSIFTEVWDPNSVLQCHKYWSPPDRPSVQGYVERGAELGLPVYMGETGENNLDWLQTAFQLYDDCGMSWNLWPWKKIETLTSPCSVDTPEGWSDVVDYTRGLAGKPAPERAWAILVELLERVDVSRCTYRTEVVNAILHRAPLRMPAWGFGFRGENVSYKTAAGRPLPGFRSDDRVTLRCRQLADGVPEFRHTEGGQRGEEAVITVELATGDWVAYEFELAAASVVSVRVGVADENPASPRQPLSIRLDDETLAAETFGSVVSGATSLPVAAGPHTVRVAANGGVAGVLWVEVAPVDDTPAAVA